MVGDGRCPAGKPLKEAPEEVGVPSGRWVGRGLAAFALASGAEVPEWQAELLFGEGRCSGRRRPFMCCGLWPMTRPG